MKEKTTRKLKWLVELVTGLALGFCMGGLGMNILSQGLGDTPAERLALDALGVGFILGGVVLFFMIVVEVREEMYWEG